MTLKLLRNKEKILRNVEIEITKKISQLENIYYDNNYYMLNKLSIFGKYITKN